MGKSKNQNQNPLYNDLLVHWKEVHGKSSVTDINQFWILNGGGRTVGGNLIIRARILSLKQTLMRNKSRLHSLFLNMEKEGPSQPSQVLSSGSSSSSSVSGDIDLSSPTLTTNNDDAPVAIQDPEEAVDEIPRKKRVAPTQKTLMDDISLLDKRIASITELKMQNAAMPCQLKTLREDIVTRSEKMKKLNELRKSNIRVKKFRKNREKGLLKVKEQDPATYRALTSTLNLHDKVGRPSLNLKQPGLLDAILEIVNDAAGADDKRSSEQLNAPMGLKTLHERIKAKGFKLSKQTLYNRLLPKRSNSAHGLRHVNTVPVRLISVQNDKRKQHDDSHFCSAFILYLKNLCQLMGDKAVLAISQDDKARVPLGIPAAKSNHKIIMRMDYRVSLHDHNFPVGPRHTLIPSVYALLAFKPDGSLSYSGPTFIAIRSGKHDKSTAQSHAIDLKQLLQEKDFEVITKTGARHVKPIVVIFTDGGPDENPRYEGPMKEAAIHFKEHDLDAIFIATHAPGHSAYNQVERRMAPLSRDLVGVVIPHDSFGDHLVTTREKGDTPEVVVRKNEEQLSLEKRNFWRAGECLAHLWNEKVIDNYPVVAKFVEPQEESAGSRYSFITQTWMDSHVQQSQYSLQIIKCDDRKCCSKPRTNIKDVLGGFIPAPVPYIKTESGSVPCSQDQTTNGHYGSLYQRIMLKGLDPTITTKPLQFDYFCPTQKAALEERTCSICSHYFPSKKARLAHYSLCKIGSRVETTASLSLDPEIMEVNQEDPPEIPVHCTESQSLEPEFESMEIIEHGELSAWCGEVFEAIEVADAESQFLL